MSRHQPRQDALPTPASRLNPPAGPPNTPANVENPPGGSRRLGPVFAKTPHSATASLATRKDDPAQVAVRNSDWGEFLTMLDGRQQYIVRATAEGESYAGQAAHLRVTPSAITQRRHSIAKRAREFWGDEVLVDAQILPLWRRQTEKR